MTWIKLFCHNCLLVNCTLKNLTFSCFTQGFKKQIKKRKRKKRCWLVNENLDRWRTMLTALWDVGPLTHFTSQFFGRSLLMTEISAIYNPISLVWVTLLTGRAYTLFSYSPRIRQIYILLVIVWKSLIVKERHTGLFKDKIQIPNINGKLIIVFADTRHLKIINWMGSRATCVY